MIDLQSKTDTLIVVDVQNDFLPGGTLAVPEGDQIIPVLNHYIDRFTAEGLPIFATRDWHPPKHCSFRAQGGPWPPHCIAETPGAQFPSELRLPSDVRIISSATHPEREAYSGFDETNLAQQLNELGRRRLFIGGLATDYCVLWTVRDARKLDFEVFLLRDAVRAINVNPGDEQKALDEMQSLEARFITLQDLA
ncbi:MAG: isochorismatase family protein [Methylohalobius sp. ZOD2]|nr:isochorismatase family protein [Methylothermaceae bacterium]